VVLLGPSGCGKNHDAALHRGASNIPPPGGISIGGRLVSAAPQTASRCRRVHANIGMVFQSYAVWPHMTVKQNVAYPLRHRRVSRAEIEAQRPATC